MDDKFVNPGDRLSTEEEYAPSDNTYVEDGSIYAAATGTQQIKDGRISVAPIREIKKFSRDMLVLGTVADDMKKVVFVHIDNISSKNKEYFAPKDGKIIMMSRGDRFGGGGGRPMRGGMDRGGRDGERESEERSCGTGDTIIARVIAEETDIYVLGLGGPETGVVYSWCKICGEQMKKGDRPGILLCDNCRRSEHKKVSTHYNNPQEIKKLFS